MHANTGFSSKHNPKIPSNCLQTKYQKLFIAALSFYQCVFITLEHGYRVIALRKQSFSLQPQHILILVLFLDQLKQSQLPFFQLSNLKVTNYQQQQKSGIMPGLMGFMNLWHIDKVRGFRQRLSNLFSLNRLVAMSVSLMISRPGRSQGLLYKQPCDKLID